ncbi:hypothetical protein Lfu02_38570 [Longispora fulva]|uniref:Putative thioesterase n=1 Tax=Longispora fulva TaxID=619741 RepID=A0A8J7GY15_9ACTN|nr:hotdog domain-containing protein [Longispora fulva]MBG6141365.1 putative thioesterase [Longispora fulva]GIG59485.1 hypothetical protein Lfu02_38570 [Longispora fulva]
MELLPGLSARLEMTVTDADTAQAMGSGDVPVLGTPRALGLAEAATVAATARKINSGSTTVGVHVEFSHLAPSVIGHTVVCEAILADVQGRRLIFTVTLHDADTLVAEGRIERLVVDRHRFVEKAHGIS